MVWLWCMLASIVLHFCGFVLVRQLPPEVFGGAGGDDQPQARDSQTSTGVRRIVFARQKIDIPKPESTLAQNPPQAKEVPQTPTTAVLTHPDQESLTPPDSPNYIGTRDTKATSEITPTTRGEQMPALAGERERHKDEAPQTFDQERQDGDLSSENNLNATASAGLTPSLPSPVAPDHTTQPSTQIADPALMPSTLAVADIAKVNTETVLREDASTADLLPYPALDKDKGARERTILDPTETVTGENHVEGESTTAPESQGNESANDQEANQHNAEFNRTVPVTKRPAQGKPTPTPQADDQNERLVPPSRAHVTSGVLSTPSSSNSVPAPSISPSPASKAPVYDPAFAGDTQPGMRTYHRRDRAQGVYDMGNRAALNVVKTPTGQYEADAYRAIAAAWYGQCDINREFLVPGTISIRIIITPQGKVKNMEQLRRNGANEAQKSFTYTAISIAPIPPMPAEVRQDLVGDVLEMIINFHFQ